jgi:hypothetical protein
VTFDVDSRFRPDDLDGDSPPPTQDSLDAQIPADAALRQRQAAAQARALSAVDRLTAGLDRDAADADRAAAAAERSLTPPPTHRTSRPTGPDPPVDAVVSIPSAARAGLDGALSGKTLASNGPSHGDAQSFTLRPTLRPHPPTKSNPASDSASAGKSWHRPMSVPHRNDVEPAH